MSKFIRVFVVKMFFLQLHVAECPDRAAFDRYKYNIDVGRAIRPEPVQARVNFTSLESEENWDDDVKHIYHI